MNLTYEYSPYTGQDGEEIPAFVIEMDGVKVVDTNEDLPADEQEAMAILFTKAPEMLKLLREGYDLYSASEGIDADWASRVATLLKTLEKHDTGN